MFGKFTQKCNWWVFMILLNVWLIAKIVLINVGQTQTLIVHKAWIFKIEVYRFDLFLLLIVGIFAWFQYSFPKQSEDKTILGRFIYIFWFIAWVIPPCIIVSSIFN